MILADEPSGTMCQGVFSFGRHGLYFAACGDSEPIVALSAPVMADRILSMAAGQGGAEAYYFIW